jgi:hypothetical protein
LSINFWVAMRSQRASESQHFVLLTKVLKTSRGLAQGGPRAKAGAQCGTQRKPKAEAPGQSFRASMTRYDLVRVSSYLSYSSVFILVLSNRNVSLREPRRVAQTPDWVS